MRPKFRAWDKEKNKMFEPTYRAYAGELEDLLILLKGDLILRKIDETIHESLFPDRFILMQSTGLKDKNGVEIYEGDIVKWSRLCIDFSLENYEERSDNFAVEWDVYNTGFVLGGGEAYLYKDISVELEVIGNIYENPELLEESK